VCPGDKVEARASIGLKVRGRLEPSQVRAIRHLVDSPVRGLKPERVSVVDERGRLLADGASDGNSMSGAGGDERKVALENRLRKEVEDIVTSIVGPDHARVQITADFDVNRITTTSDKYDPDGRVVRSSQSREEESDSNKGRAGGAVSVGNELPGANSNSTAGGDRSRKSEEIVNYEISRTTKTEVVEAGRVNRISAAVLVDGTYVKNEKGDLVYKPRSKEEIDRIASLVRSAIGFDAKRGDQVEVVNLPFAQTPPIAASGPTGWMSYFQFTKDDVMSTAEKGVMALLGLIVMFIVVRPLVRRIVTPDNAPLLTAARAGAAGVAGALGVPAVVPAGGALSDNAGSAAIATSEQTVA